MQRSSKSAAPKQTARMAWTAPQWVQYATQCQFTPSCERACLKQSNACYNMCQYNSQCANMCNEQLLQCVTRPDPKLFQ